MKQEFVELVISGESVSSKHRNMSLRGFSISLAASLLIFLCYIAGFCVFRRHLRSIYEPRTFIRSKNTIHAPPTKNGLISWIVPVFKAKHSAIMFSLGLDAYFFLRFTVFVMVLCAVISFPFIVTLIPIHLLGNREGVKGMDRISILNIANDQRYLHIAHLVLESTCMALCMIMFNRELKVYFTIRAKYMLNKSRDDASGSCSTILVKEIKPTCNPQTVAQTFNGISKTWNDSQAVKKIWFNRDYSKLHSLVHKRSVIVNKLENSQLWLIEKCLCLGESTPEDWRNGNKDATITGNLWREYMAPEHLGSMYGTKGSHITWLKGELSRLNAEIYALQTNEALSPVSNSCFIQFTNNISAFVASRSLITSDVLGKRVKIYGKVYPADIIWCNLSGATWTKRIVKILSIALNFIFIFGWAIPVALISIATQVDKMEKWMPHVHGAANSPGATYIMNGVLTPIIVSSVTSMIPCFFRVLSKLKGFPTNTLVEMDVQNYLFLFMFFQLFLIVTMSSGLPALIITTLVNTSEGAMTLANSLPKATTFFISYVLANSLTTAGNTLLQSMQLCMAVYYRIFASTPREKFQSRYITNTIYWGSVYPLVSNVASIAIAYALISPVIFISAIVGLGALYMAFKYRILYCYIPRCIADGDYYPKAIFQLFAGIYCQQISLLGNFLVSGQVTLAVFAAMVIVATIISHRHLRSVFVDMKTRIPISEVSCRDTEEGCGANFPTGTSPVTLHDKGRFDKNVSSPESIMSDVTLTEQRNYKKKKLTPEETSPGWGSPHTDASPASVTSCATNASASTMSNSIDSDTWAMMFDTMGLEFNGLSSGQKEYITNSLFEHPDRWLQRPCVWLPNDWKGVAQDQVQEMLYHFPNMRGSSDGAEIDKEGNVYITKAPPDFDPRDIMRM